MNEFKRHAWVITRDESDLDVEKSLDLLSKMDTLAANTFLAYYYCFVKEPDDVEKIEYYKNKILGKEEDSDDFLYAKAMFELDERFYEDRDSNRALELFEEAGKKGNPLAYIELGDYLLENSTNRKEEKEAITYYKKALELGFKEALLILGEVYIEIGDIRKARKTFKLAIEEGLDGYWGLSLLEDDDKKAIQLLEKSCEFKKNSKNLFDLADIMMTEDEELAFKLLNEAAKLGSGEAHVVLGIEYYLGENLEKDYDKAFKHFELADQQANTLGTFHLAMCYIEGHGVKKDLEKAKELLTIAADEGSEDAIEVLESFFE